MTAGTNTIKTDRALLINIILDRLMVKKSIEIETRESLYSDLASDVLIAYHDGVMNGLSMALDVICEEYDRVMSVVE